MPLQPNLGLGLFNPLPPGFFSLPPPGLFNPPPPGLFSLPPPGIFTPPPPGLFSLPPPGIFTSPPPGLFSPPFPDISILCHQPFLSSADLLQFLHFNILLPSLPTAFKHLPLSLLTSVCPFSGSWAPFHPSFWSHDPPAGVFSTWHSWLVPFPRIIYIFHHHTCPPLSINQHRSIDFLQDFSLKCIKLFSHLQSATKSTLAAVPQNAPH